MHAVDRRGRHSPVAFPLLSQEAGPAVADASVGEAVHVFL